MNSRQLLKLGVPQECLKEATLAIQKLVSAGAIKGKSIKKRLVAVLGNPGTYVTDEHLGGFAGL